MRKNKLLGLCLTLSAVLIGCEGTIDKHGYHLEKEDFKKLKVGVHTKDDVAQILGSPSSTATFHQNDWYYLGKETNTVAFFNPKVLNQHACIVHFNAKDVVESVECQEGEKDVSTVQRKTESAGYEQGVFRDIFGNFGKLGSTKAPSKRY